MTDKPDMPEKIWAENGCYYDYPHSGGKSYTRTDIIEAEFKALRGTRVQGCPWELVDALILAIPEYNRSVSVTEAIEAIQEVKK